MKLQTFRLDTEVSWGLTSAAEEQRFGIGVWKNAHVFKAGLDEAT